jgi:hypothetical protein
LATEKTRPRSPEALARPHLYEDERIVWIERQRVGRISAFRLLLATPGMLLVALAAWLATRSSEVEREGVEPFLVMLFVVGAAWLWATVYKPIEAYQGVRRVYAVLTDHRLLFVEALSDGTSRVRHPYRPAILRPGDVRSVAVRAHTRGRGVIRVRSAATRGARADATVRIRGGGRSGMGVEEAAALLRHHLAAPGEAPTRRGMHAATS